MSLEASRGAVLERGDAAPPLELPGAAGETYTLADFAGCDALLLVFTCNHCPYAQAKIPVLNALAREFDDVAVVGINPNDAEAYPDDSMDAMRALVAAGDVAYDAYLRDEDQSVAAAYGAVCTPDPFLFARDDGAAMFRLVYHGRLDDSGNAERFTRSSERRRRSSSALNPDEEPSGEPGFEMRRAIEAVLAGEPVDVEQRPSQGCSIKWLEGNEPDWW